MILGIIVLTGISPMHVYMLKKNEKKNVLEVEFIIFSGNYVISVLVK